MFFFSRVKLIRYVVQHNEMLLSPHLVELLPVKFLNKGFGDKVLLSLCFCFNTSLTAILFTFSIVLTSSLV